MKLKLLWRCRQKHLKILVKKGCTILPYSEQKARATYEKLINLCKDNPDVIEPLRFLRAREVVHFQRFGEALRGVQDKLAEKRMYSINNHIMNMNQDNTRC